MTTDPRELLASAADCVEDMDTALDTDPTGGNAAALAAMATAYATTGLLSMAIGATEAALRHIGAES